MGLIKTIKESFARARALGMQAKAELEEAARCRAMTRAEAAELSDEALWACVCFRLAALDEVPAEGPRRVAYTVDAFDREACASTLSTPAGRPRRSWRRPCPRSGRSPAGSCSTTL